MPGPVTGISYSSLSLSHWQLWWQLFYHLVGHCCCAVCGPDLGVRI